MKKLFVTILLVCLFIIPVSAQTVQREITIGTDDVLVKDPAPTNPPWNQLFDIGTGRIGNLTGDYFGGGFRFQNISIPPNAVVHEAYFTVKAQANDAANSVNGIIKAQSANNPITFSNIADYNARNRTTASVSWLAIEEFVLNTVYQSPDISDVINEVIGRPGWVFNNSIVIFFEDDNTSTADRAYYQFSGGDVPTLTINWHLPTDYGYIFTDTYYENGTLYVPPVNVTITGPGISESYNTSGGFEYYNAVEPTAFLWDIGGGATRQIHSFGSENFTVTIPDGTYQIYRFTVKDYTGKNPAFLEAYRTIGGVSTLIERMPITQPNAVPLNLVYGKTYNIKVLFADGSRYDWGYFVAAGTTDITITLRTVEFSDQIQPLYGVIFVEATRSSNGTTITVDYNDTRTNTEWANVTISIRGGAVVQQIERSNDTYTVNWASANADLGYIVTVSGLHDDFGVWGYVKILDNVETFPAAPDLTGIFDFGLGSNLIGYVLCTVTMIGFSKAMESKAVITGALMATLLNFIGWTTYTANQIIFFWFFAIIVALAIGGNE